MQGGSPNIMIELSSSFSDPSVQALFKEQEMLSFRKMVKSIDLNIETTESDLELREIDQHFGDDECSSARKEPSEEGALSSIKVTLSEREAWLRKLETLFTTNRIES
ncbi:hypothetical protein PanWU01x14_314010 [Parasponia andersonii]|uniref:Uncharacterized protein n=1 Tax=Parasponia andersonii TaxID=3476 RepID=A0A2P5ANW4_PARAD|nr:hypothetical protein PanWU01x14_314010 [Parasponia andersonii]